MGEAVWAVGLESLALGLIKKKAQRPRWPLRLRC